MELRPAERLLVERARDYLKGGSATAESLISHVCQMPGAPLLHNISDDHRKGGDLDSLQAHANALTAAFSTNEARDESG